MTVCIAAICHWNQYPYIVGASDKMITYGDIEYEPQQSKVFVLSQSIVALVSGSAAIQTVLCTNTEDEIRRLGVANISVSEAAKIFANQYALYRRNQAEKKILTPLGLDINNFMSAQGVPVDLLARLMRDLKDCDLEVESIVAGIDYTGAHIYTIKDPGVAECQDYVAFAAIGGGSYRAESQFMLAEYTRYWWFHRALLLTAIAKKRSEVVPGVGEQTDFFYVGGSPLSVITIAPDMQEHLYSNYETLNTEQKASVEQANKRIDNYVNNLLEKQNSAIQAQATEGTHSDQGEIRGDPTQS